MAVPFSQPRPGVQAPAPLEVGLVFLLTIGLSTATAFLLLPLLGGSPYRILLGWATHAVMLVVPWVWYRLRVAPAVAPERRPLLRWRKEGARLFWVMVAWVLAVKFGLSVVEALVGPTPGWVRNGPGPIALTLLFQGGWVGLTEEMMMRPALQLPLSLRLGGRARIGSWEFSHAVLWTALAFGLFHLPNALFGRSLAATASQALFAAVVGLFFGIYYERSDNYLGAAVLHNVLDVAGYAAVILVMAL